MAKGIEHFDIIGQPIIVGCYVAVCVYNNLHVARVIKLNSKMAKVKVITSEKRSYLVGSEYNRYPADMTVLSNEYTTFHLLKVS